MIKYLIKAISSRSNIPTVYRAWYSSSSSSFKRSRCSIVCTHYTCTCMEVPTVPSDARGVTICESVSVCRFGVIFVHSQVCPKSLKVLLPYRAYNTSNYYFQY